MISRMRHNRRRRHNGRMRRNRRRRHRRRRHNRRRKKESLSSRSAIFDKIVKLQNEKSEAIDKCSKVDLSYNKKLVLLIKDILDHSRKYWGIETDQQRKKNLHNLALVAQLFRYEFTLHFDRIRLGALEYWHRLSPNDEVNNIWRNLQFMVRFKITPLEHRSKQVLDIEPKDVNDLLWELSENGIWQNLDLLFDKLNKYEDNSEGKIDMTSVYHNYPLDLPCIQALAVYGRETLRIEKIQKAIQFATKKRKLESDVDRLAFLRQLQIIGESSTTKNLSFATKALAPNIHWQLLVNLRNRLSHDEGDLENQNIRLLTEKVHGEVIDELVVLGKRMKALIEEHADIGKSKASDHYKSHDLIISLSFSEEEKKKINCFLEKLSEDQNLKNEIGELKSLIAEGTEVDSKFEAIVKNLIESNKRKKNSNLGQLIQILNKIGKRRKKKEDCEQKKLLKIEKIGEGSQTNLLKLYDDLNSSGASGLHQQKALTLAKAIQCEIESMQNMFTSERSSYALKYDYPEETVRVEEPEVISPLAAQYPDMFKPIQNYCERAGLHLHMDLPKSVMGSPSAGFSGSFSNRYSCNQSLLQKYLLEYSAKCELYIKLLDEPEIVEACYFHMARIPKLMERLTSMLDVDKLLALELKALRNYVHHGSDFADTIGPEVVKFAVRYVSLYCKRLSPSIDAIVKTLKCFEAVLGQLLELEHIG